MNQRNNIIDVKPVRIAFGNVRRENLNKEIMYKSPTIPQTVGYDDIDETFKDWVDNTIDISYDGIKIPTYTLLTNQRFSEYSQTWKHTDESNSPIMNFKTFTRDSNPSKGNINGGTMNIPGNRFYQLATVPVKQDNGVDCYDVYQMRQPFGVDLTYSVSIFTNKWELLTLMNTKMQDLFKSIECYIRVNGHYMCMLLENVSDESEYTLDNKKYFSQTFTIKCLAYILTEDDFKIERVPKRILTAVESEKTVIKPKVTIEDFEDNKIELTAFYPKGSKDIAKFKSDEDLKINSVDLDNVDKIEIIRNDSRENININDEFEINKDEKIIIKLKKTKYWENAEIKLNGITYS